LTKHAKPKDGLAAPAGEQEPLSTELATLVAQLEAYGPTRGDGFGRELGTIARELASSNPTLLRAVAQAVRERPRRPQVDWEGGAPGGALRLDPGGKAKTYSEHVGRALLAEAALGTSSQETFAQFLAELESVVRSRDAKPGTNSQHLNAALAIMAALDPANELETALGLQMVAAHVVAMDLAARARHAESLLQLQTCGNLATKFQRTFAAQMEALAKLRSGGKQQVEVRYVYVNGNALIGDVQATAGGRGDGGFSGQAHAPTQPGHFPGDVLPPLWGQDAIRQAMPRTSREGEAAMPDARRGQRQRSA